MTRCQHLCGCKTDGMCCDSEYLAGGYLPLAPACEAALTPSRLNAVKVRAGLCWECDKPLRTLPTLLERWQVCECGRRFLNSPAQRSSSSATTPTPPSR